MAAHSPPMQFNLGQIIKIILNKEMHEYKYDICWETCNLKLLQTLVVTHMLSKYEARPPMLYFDTIVS